MTGGAWLSSARVVRCWVKSRNERNPYPVSYTHLDVYKRQVEDCVNKVGVDLNTASVSLLEYISGISKTIAKNIVDYRERCV